MAKGVFGVSFLVFALGVFVLEAVRSPIVKVNGSVAYWASYFGHALSKCDRIFTCLHWLIAYHLAQIPCLLPRSET